MADVLRRGDLVEVKSPAEILATLDDSGALGDLPFMPEMAAHCGRRFVVDSRAERICDTVHDTGTRRLRETVFLDQPRCTGAAHGGCQAECRTLWKEQWLRRVTPGLPAAENPGAGLEALMERIAPNVKRKQEAEGRAGERWRCQITELPRATEHVRQWNVQSMMREVSCGNVDLGHFLRVAARAAVLEPRRKLGLLPDPPLTGPGRGVVDPPLHLEPGDLVQVKSIAEITETLNAAGRTRGLWFDREMVPFCGGTYRVRQRVNRIIDEKDGHMIELKTDCVTLEGVTCSGDLSLRRWFCRRAIFPYWRECWLRRVEPASGASGTGARSPANVVGGTGT